MDAWIGLTGCRPRTSLIGGESNPMLFLHPTLPAMTPHKNDTTDLRNRYPVFFEFGLALSLGLVLFFFTIPIETTSTLDIVETQQEIVLVEEVEQTRQIEKPPPPKPPAPVEVANETVTQEIDLDFDMDLDLNETVSTPSLPPPPPAPEPEAAPEPEPDIFVIVEQPPTLIGGLAALQARLKYPEVARLAGLEGTVFVQFVVDQSGNVTDPVCVRDPGGGMCDEALRVARLSKFEPGRQRGKPVKVRFSLPVKFRLQ